MNSRQIEVFHAVYSSKSVSAAARILNVSQPSVSKILKHTEDRLGFSLFQLVRGRLVATEEAHILFGKADELATRIGLFQQTARNLKSSTEGIIRIGVLPSLALSVVPEAIARFGAVAPRVGFDISTIHHDTFRTALTARNCDFVIGHHLLRDPGITAVPLGTGRLGALFRRDLIPGAHDRIDRDMLRDHDVISLAPSVAIAGLAAPLLADRPSRRRVITVRTVYVAGALAREGAGVAIIDEFTARGLATPHLCFLPLDPVVTFDLNALHMAELPLSRLTRSFLDLVRQILVPAAGSPGATPA
ncbi:LysR family transcriptional regulator [Sphingomonas prati]|uniref:DNA-binding transcriptional LysR family regulator n=1 Tax=Sphingomonas prati TaxID=1843237 RepID=A0A7W9F2X9_9SPHN|nr:LysR family transcriptional regulator [Sphingomonas prati]MBB5729289.1 DNA-binding transcriptional LysR family regulator [Sphingomonas prati]GGE78603.1 LysR family transcriptional regulator [Sphingomonas prati]